MSNPAGPTASEVIQSLQIRLSSLESKVDAIQGKLELTTPKPPTASPPPYSPQSTPTQKPILREPPRFQSNSETHSVSSAGQILGYAGVACLFFATVLLIRLSIDSGWLTPLRQLALAGVFGAILIGLPFLKVFKDRSYMNQLPALGIVVFHLTIYGGVFYHKLIDPEVGLLLISGVGILSLMLLEQIHEESYVLVSVFGTYLGAVFLKGGFSNTMGFFHFIMIWNLIYIAYSIYSGERKIILLASYMSIGLVGIKVMSVNPSSELHIQAAAAQMIQFLCFLIGSVLFSKIKKQPLTYQESWAFFPLILFFYGLEYDLLDKIGPDLATAFSVALAGIIFLAYRIGGKSEEELDSAGVTYTTVATLLAHSIYCVRLTDEMKILTPLIFFILAFGSQGSLRLKKFQGLLTVIGLMSLYSFGLIFIGNPSIHQNFLILSGGMYGLLMLILVFRSLKNEVGMKAIALVFAHSQILLAIYRMTWKSTLLSIDRSFIAPFWIFYAFIILFFALKQKDTTLGKSAFPVIALGLLRFLVVDFERLASGSRILALGAMGALIFASGYIYKKTLEE